MQNFTKKLMNYKEVFELPYAKNESGEDEISGYNFLPLSLEEETKDDPATRWLQENGFDCFGNEVVEPKEEVSTSSEKDKRAQALLNLKLKFNI